jgi:hypothetical protein
MNELMQHPASKDKKKSASNKIRIEKQPDLENPPPKGIHKQRKITKTSKVTKSHKAIQ